VDDSVRDSTVDFVLSIYWLVSFVDIVHAFVLYGFECRPTVVLLFDFVNLRKGNVT